MTSLLQKIPYKWRKALYSGVAILTAGLFAFGIASPDTFNAVVQQWVATFTMIANLFAAVTALEDGVES